MLYVALKGHDGRCLGFTTKQNLDLMSEEARAIYIGSDVSQVIEFEGPEYQPNLFDLIKTMAEFAVRGESCVIY